MKLGSVALWLTMAGCLDVAQGDGEDDGGKESGTADPVDADGDGFAGSEDCADDDNTTYPGAAELCDGHDNDCDGQVDEDGEYFIDSDGDGFGDPSTRAQGCPPGEGFADNGADCNDVDAAINPAATEVCDGKDNDCDDQIDEDVSPGTWYQDADGDGYGLDSSGVVTCDPEDGWVMVGGDCDDFNASSNPEGIEICDLVDNDCDGEIDEDAEDMETWYADTDGDGYGDPAAGTLACEAPVGTVADATDCDDTLAAVNPGADELCDGVDNDCDGTVDGVSVEGTFYRDEDGDGYGAPDSTVTGCSMPDGYALDGTDCDDDDASVYPGAPDEWYDGEDSNCDGADDYDADGDGYASDGYGGDDCNDSRAAINPGASETWYDGTDQDCDGSSDYDQDRDGYDSEVYGGDDCNDTDASTYPGAFESDDSVDHDCDGELEWGPIADASYDGTVAAESCSTVYLDGSGSSDPDGGAITFSWEALSVPAASAVTTDDIDSATDESPTLFVDASGSYTLGLTVTDDDGNASVRDDLVLAVVERTTNAAPVADAGADATQTSNTTCAPVDYSTTEYSCVQCASYLFNLDGTGSADADGEPLTYEWSVASGTASISGSSTGSTVSVLVTGATPAYGSTADATVVVRLRVSDCYGATSAYNTATLTYTCSGVPSE